MTTELRVEDTHPGLDLIYFVQQIKDMTDAARILLASVSRLGVTQAEIANAVAIMRGSGSSS